MIVFKKNIIKQLRLMNFQMLISLTQRQNLKKSLISTKSLEK